MLRFRLIVHLSASVSFDFVEIGGYSWTFRGVVEC